MEAIRMKAARVTLGLVLCLGCVVGAAAACVAASGEACAAQQAGWVKSGSRWWYAQSGGGYARGWLKVGSSWYWFDSSGWMATGWLQQGGKWYYLKGSGAMAVGWQRVGSTWYWLDASGAMRTGWLQQGAKWYYLKGSGAMATGWQRAGSSWYWFDASGAMASSRWVGDYYLGASGAMATSQWVGAYYVGADGRWIPGYGQAPVTPASDLEYKVGNFDPREFSSGSANYYPYVELPGYGVYITGYKGSSRVVRLPKEIDGVPVVYADLSRAGDGDTVEDITQIDVGLCSDLKWIEWWSADSVLFGGARSIQVISAQGCPMASLDMSALPDLRVFYAHGSFPSSSFSINVASLRYFGSTAGRLGSLNLSGATHLEVLEPGFLGGDLTNDTLDLTGCVSLTKVDLRNNALTSFDPGQFPNLSVLSLAGNPIRDTAALKAWGAQDGHELYL